MQKVFDNPSKLESLAKQKFGFPDFIMLENAALSIKKLLLDLSSASNKQCLILCGKGNNGGDGYALARLIYGEFEPLVFCLELPAAPEAKKQYEICRKLGIKFISKTQLPEHIKNAGFIIDCLYGTGFKGELSPAVSKIITAANNSKAIRIACDISTALAFNAHYTVTMGEQKLQLFSDKAKVVCGNIIVASLGLDRTVFENVIPASKVPAFLVTDNDIRLPLRKNKAAHKGTYGHTAVMTGEKSGAAIICATAAMNFGSGLTTLTKRPSSNLSQFKISPELMISEPNSKKSAVIPAKTTCLVFGPGIEKIEQNDFETILTWFNNGKAKAPAAVFDAGVFGNPLFPDFLKAINKLPEARIVLTPHLLELLRLCQSLKLFAGLTVEELANNPQIKIKVGKKLNSLFPKTTIVIKSANTFIASEGQTYIVTDGVPSLAKGGSGDVLAGMIAALLAQGYSATEAAITACQTHAKAAKKYGEDAFSLTPAKILSSL